MRSQCPLLAFPKGILNWQSNTKKLRHKPLIATWTSSSPSTRSGKITPLHSCTTPLQPRCSEVWMHQHLRPLPLLSWKALFAACNTFFLKTGGSNKTCEQRFKHSWLQSSGVLISLLVVFSFLKKKWCDSASLVFLDEALFQRTKNKEHEITSLSTSNMIWRNANQGRLQHRLTHSGRAPPHPTTLVNPLLLHSTTPTHTTLRTELQHLQM